jgi:uncharacterized membrane protein
MQLMKLLKNKRGIAGSNLDAKKVIFGVILLVILFEVLAIALPLVNTAGNTLNATGVPFASFFVANGIIMLAIMGAVIIAVVAFVMKKKGGR